MEVVQEPKIPFPRFFVECETLEGISITLPSQCVEVISDPFEIATVKSKLPRALVKCDYDDQHGIQAYVSSRYYHQRKTHETVIISSSFYCFSERISITNSYVGD